MGLYCNCTMDAHSGGGIEMVRVTRVNSDSFTVDKTSFEVAEMVEQGKTVILDLNSTEFNSGLVGSAFLCGLGENSAYFVGFTGDATDNMHLILYTLDKLGIVTDHDVYAWT